MITTPQIIHTKSHPTAVIRLTIPRAQIQTVMSPAIAEVLEAIPVQKIAGAVFSYHLKLDPVIFDLEVGAPISEPLLESVGRVYASELPAAMVARTTYQGAYDGLAAAWGEFMEWIAASEYKPAAGLWESYVFGPESTPDSSLWRTELNRILLN